MSKKITVAIAGLGSRGKDTYARMAKLFADRMELVAVADIVPEKVEEAVRNIIFQKSAALTAPNRF